MIAGCRFPVLHRHVNRLFPMFPTSIFVARTGYTIYCWNKVMNSRLLALWISISLNTALILMYLLLLSFFKNHSSMFMYILLWPTQFESITNEHFAPFGAISKIFWNYKIITILPFFRSRDRTCESTVMLLLDEAESLRWSRWIYREMYPVWDITNKQCQNSLQWSEK